MDAEIFHNYLNEYGERIQRVGDMELNLDYWDCECEGAWIHPITHSICETCGAEQVEWPSSRENEVKYHLDEQRDWRCFKV